MFLTYHEPILFYRPMLVILCDLKDEEQPCYDMCLCVCVCVISNSKAYSNEEVILE